MTLTEAIAALEAEGIKITPFNEDARAFHVDFGPERGVLDCFPEEIVACAMTMAHRKTIAMLTGGAASWVMQ